MNMAMQQPVSYPFYMDASRLPLSVPWSSAPYQQQPVSSPYPMLQSFALPQQRHVLPRSIPSTSSFSNTRYNHLKQSTSYSNRRPVHRSVDTSSRAHRHPLYTDSIHSYRSRASKTKSISDLEQISQSSSVRLPKAHSWHTMANHHQSNLSVVYAKEMHKSTPKLRRKNSLPKKTKPPSQRRLPSSLPKRKTSFRNQRKRSIHLPECGVVRISTLDEMPIPNQRTHSRTNSNNNDRISTKGSISNSSKRRIKPKEKSQGTNSIENRSIQTNDQDDETVRINSDIQSSSSSSSSNRSYSSLQQRLNGSLRNDPLITAAMEDYRQLQRSSSQTTSLTSHRRDLSRDSLRSNSTLHSSSSSSDNHSQSSFTSVERSEIRQLIKTVKTKDTKSLNNPLQSSPPPSPLTISPPPRSIPTRKPRKSSLTEELDREFNKLRALDPHHEINIVTPSSICKRKKTLEKPSQSVPPLPTFDALLRQVQLRPIEKSTKPVCLKETPTTDNHYANPLISIPVPRSSPIPSEEIKRKEIIHEYAVPIKKRSLPQISHFQPSRNLKFNKSISEKRTSRSLSMLNWFHQNLTNPFPTTFQPNRIIDHPNESGNIYTSDMDVYSPSMNKTDDQHSLQIHLDNQTIRTDDFYSDYETKQTTTSSSILDDFSHLFTRKHKHENKLQRCSIM